LEDLVLAGGAKSELKEIGDLLLLIAHNKKLVSLDVSENEMGSRGAQCLGKYLHINNKIHTLKWDGNNVGYVGFEMFFSGLKKNKSLINMPLPYHDVEAASKVGATKELLDKVIRDIEITVLRNNSPNQSVPIVLGNPPSLSSATTSASLFSFFSSGGREECNQWLTKIKSTGRKVSDSSSIVTIEDAQNSDNGMTNLFVHGEELQVLIEEDIKKGLAASVESLTPVAEKIKANLVAKIQETVVRNFKCLDEDVVRRLKVVLQFGAKDVDRDELTKLLVDAAGRQLNAKYNANFHNILSLSSDYVYEKVATQLKEIYEGISYDVAQEKIQSDIQAKETTVVTPKQTHIPKTAPKEEPKKVVEDPKKVVEEPKKEEIKKEDSKVEPKKKKSKKKTAKSNRKKLRKKKLLISP